MSIRNGASDIIIMADQDHDSLKKKPVMAVRETIGWEKKACHGNDG